MEVVLAPGASGRAGSVVNLGRGSTGAGPYQPPVLAAVVAAHNTASGGGAYSPPAPSSVKQEDTTTPPGPMSSAEGVALAAAAVATGSNESLAGPPPLMLGKNVAVDWKGILGRGCSCVVYRGMLTLPPGEGPAAGVAEGATIPVAVKLLMHLAAAAVEEGGAAAVPTSAGDGSDRAVGDGAALPAALAQLNPVPLSPELRGQLRMLQAEVAVLSRLDHPNIVKYYGACLDPTTTAAGAVRNSSGGGLETSSASAGGDAGSGSGKSGATSYSVPPGMSIDMPFLVEELMHVPLSRVIHARHLNGSGAFLHDYGLVDILRICRDVANALAYLHPTVVHRDLKPANVLLDERGTAKVGDFGLARFKAGTLLATTNVEVGTTPYMAPENFAAGGEAAVSDKSDVFALGVLINEMVTRQRPWTGTRSAVVGYLVAIEGQRPTMAPADHPHCPPGLRSLIQRCWRQNPDERPSGAEIVKRLTLLLAEHAAAAL